MVLPVPVAPAIRPWRLPYFSRRYWSLSPPPTKIEVSSAMPGA
jgi:hypothetical protein